MYSFRERPKFSLPQFEKQLCHHKTSRTIYRNKANHVFTLTVNNQAVVVKRAILGANSEAELEEEQRILKQLSNPNIVTFFMWSAQYNAMAIEYLAEGDLWSVLYNNPINGNPADLSSEQSKNIIRQVVCGLDYLYTKNIAHLDIKPENIFIRRLSGSYSSVSYQAKIGDFGTAVQFKKGEERRFLDHLCGTSAYAAPEMIASNLATYQADIFSLGCLIYEIEKRIQPFYGDFLHEPVVAATAALKTEKQQIHNDILMQKVKEGWRAPFKYRDNPVGLRYTLREPEIFLNIETMDLIQQCWKQSPDERPSIKKILSHGFFSRRNNLTSQKSADMGKTDASRLIDKADETVSCCSSFGCVVS